TLKNVPTAVCGKLAIETSGHPALAMLPEFLCGCGDGLQSAANTLPCLRNVADGACGAVPVTTDAELAAIAALPNGLCGCGDGQVKATACLDNVPTDVCGSVAKCTTVNGTGTAAGCPEGQLCV